MVHRQCFLACFQLLVFTIIVCSLWWIFGYLGGLTSGATQLYWLLNWHQLLMIVAFLFCFSNAVILYRVYEVDYPSQRKLHIGFQIACLLLLLAGLVFVVTWKMEEAAAETEETEISSNSLYTFHSWCGVCTVIAFVMQFVLTVVPGLQAYYSQLCVWLVVFTVLCSVATIVTGIEDVVFYRYIEGLIAYSDYVTEGILVNTLAVLILLLLLLVLWAWFRAPYSAADRVEYQDMGSSDNTHATRPLKGVDV